MKTLSLRTLLRDPLKVKRITRTGNPVQVTDHGKPLWILQPAQGTEASEARRCSAIHEILKAVLREKPSKITLSDIIRQSRQ